MCGISKLSGVGPVFVLNALFENRSEVSYKNSVLSEACLELLTSKNKMENFTKVFYLKKFYDITYSTLLRQLISPS